MANPQLEDGYFRISNEFYDALCQIRIPGESRQVFDFILRKTWGWKKKDDWIPLSQFENGTLLKKRTIVKARKRLLEMNLIITQKGDGEMTLYKINKDFATWKSSPKKITSPNRGRPITQMGDKPSPKKLPSKDTTKNNSSKDNIALHPEAGILTDCLIFQILKNHPTNRLSRQVETERARRDWTIHIDRLIRVDNRGPPEIREMIMWSTEHDFWTGNILSAKKLREKWDTLAAQRDRDGKRQPNTQQGFSKERARNARNFGALRDYGESVGLFEPSGIHQGSGGSYDGFPKLGPSQGDPDTLENAPQRSDG